MADLQPHPAITRRAAASVGLKRTVLLIHWLLHHDTISLQRLTPQKSIKECPNSVPQTPSEGAGRAGANYVIQG